MPKRKEKLWLSYPISQQTPVYANGYGFKRRRVKRIHYGQGCNTEYWQMPNHIGTHVDVPKHFFNQGNTVDSYQPDFWFFTRPYLVNVSLQSGELIGYSNRFKAIPQKCDLLLIKTGYSAYRQRKKYWQDNPGIDPTLAIWLRKNRPQIRALGVDFISIAKWQCKSKGRAAHKAFLNQQEGRPIVLIEDMDLSKINKKTRFVNICIVPLIVKGADGAPCSVIVEVVK